MTTLADIEQAVDRLTPEELRAFRNWFAQRDAEAWDQQIEADVREGRLNALAEEALRERREGRCTEL